MEEWKTDTFLNEHGLIFNSLPYEIRVSIQSLKQQYGKLKKVTDPDLYEERLETLKERDEVILNALKLHVGEDDVTIDDDEDDNEPLITANSVSELIKESGQDGSPANEVIDDKPEGLSPAPAPMPQAPPAQPIIKPKVPTPTPTPEPILNDLVLDDGDKILIGVMKQGKSHVSWKELYSLGFNADILGTRGGRTTNFELHKGRFDLEYAIIPSEQVKSKYLQNG